jgi:hypothetical protein
MFALVSCTTLFASPYTNKVEEIYKKYYCYAKYGYNRGLSAEEELALAFMGPKNAALLALGNYAMSHDASLAAKWAKNMEDELEEARSLMNEDDVYNEFIATQRGQLTSLIKAQFKEIYVKDQFETFDQYKKRAQERAKISFDSICSVVMADFISSASFVIKPVSYNADKGIYNVKITEKYHEVTNEYNTSFPMESDKARNFKEITITPDDIISVEWVCCQNDIHAKKIVFREGNDIETSLITGVQCTNPLAFQYDDFRESYPLIPGYSWDISKLEDYYDAYAAEVRKRISQYNYELKSNPYYIEGISEPFLLSYENYKLSSKNRYNRAKIEEDVAILNEDIKKNYETTILQMQKVLRENYPDKFIKLYASEHSTFDYEVKLLMNDYKCYDYTYNDFAFFIIDKRTIPEKECYYKYIELFNDDAEFNSYYTDKDKFMAKVKERQNLKGIYFRLYTKAQIQDEGKFNFKEAKNAKNQEINHVYVEPFMQILEVVKWRDDVFNTFLRMDTKMAKEYAKVGTLFKNNGEFFEAYVSDDYKKILKSMK